MSESGPVADYHQVEPVPGVNIPLLRKAVEWVETEAMKPVEESAWYQPGIVTSGDRIRRSCGTAYCVAGYMAMVETGQDRPDDAIDVAVKALGLPSIDDIQGLFWADNSAADIRWIAERLAGEPL